MHPTSKLSRVTSSIASITTRVPSPSVDDDRSMDSTFEDECSLQTWIQPEGSFVGHLEHLHNFSHKQRQAYMASSSSEERDGYAKLKKEFRNIQVNIIPESEINQTDPRHQDWCERLLANTKDFKCLQPMPKTVLVEGDEPLTTEASWVLLRAHQNGSRRPLDTPFPS